MNVFTPHAAGPLEGRRVRVDRLGRLVVGAACSAAVGVICGSVMPRGPVTTPQALLALLVGAGGGLAAGYFSRSRWSMLIGPLVALVIVEVSRLGHHGLTVEAPRFDSVWGFAARLAGRGVQGLLTAVPMVVFAAIGAGIAARRLGSRPRPVTVAGKAALAVRRAITGLVVAGLAVVGVLVARPASTPRSSARTASRSPAASPSWFSCGSAGTTSGSHCAGGASTTRCCSTSRAALATAASAAPEWSSRSWSRTS